MSWTGGSSGDVKRVPSSEVGYHRRQAASELALDQIIFVFGSNLAGMHGAGAAAEAQRVWGARHGRGVGWHGWSYAIPTKDQNINVLPLYVVRFFVRQFVREAAENPDYEYQVTAIGCGLAGRTPEQIAPMFAGASANVHLPLGWRQIIEANTAITRFGKRLPF